MVTPRNTAPDVRRRNGCTLCAATVLAFSVLLIPAGAHAQAQGVLGQYALDRRDSRAVDLPRDLVEVSGLAVSADGRFFAHGDERADVFEIEPGSGRAVRRFTVGEKAVRGDFEGIAIAGGRYFLVTSAGGIVEFADAGNGEWVPYFTHRGLPAEDCEVEGLEYDARSDSLLLACKTPYAKSIRDQLVIFAFSLARMRAEPQPRFAIPLDFLKTADLGSRLSPSGLAIHPTAGTIFVLAGRENLLVELSSDGRPLGARRLAGRNHRQAEGIAFSADGTLWIADEGGNGRAKLTRYPFDVEPARP